MHQRIADSVQRLLRERIRSIEELDALILVHSEQERAFSDEEVARSLGIALEVAHTVLGGLVSSGLCRRTGLNAERTIFSPEKAWLRSSTKQLAQIHADAHCDSRPDLTIRHRPLAGQRPAGIRERIPNHQGRE
jgi:hypothetical protein